MMTTVSIWACPLLILALFRAALAFSPTTGVRYETKSRRFMSSLEDSDEMERKMALVRSLQNAYYQNSATEPTILERDTGILRNVPLWRVQWTELPGRSNVLNVHEGTYTNMFETILRSPKPWYVGHLLLPGGSKNLKSSECRFQLKTWQDEIADDDERRDADTSGERSAVVGTLLRIADFRRLADGRLILLIQALERFVVAKCVRSLPYSIAHVQILPDYNAESILATEEEARTQRANEVMESFRYHDYEYDAKFALPLSESKYLSASDIWGPDIAKVLPFVPYSKSFQLNPVDCMEVEATEDIASLTNGSSVESRLLEGGIISPPSFLSNKGADLSVEDLEDQLWTALQDFCRVSRIVLPKEVLCLLPPGRSWPTPVERISTEYPSQRRQRRLSFAASAFLEQTRVGADMRQAWLETPGTKERLR